MDNYLSVKDVNEYIKTCFDSDLKLRSIVIKAEVSNIAISKNNHMYFTLKDKDSQLSAVMFSFNSKKIDFLPSDGDELLVTGSISVYVANGKYQMIVTDYKKSGEGDILAKLELLRQKLEKDGVFEKQKSLVLPKYPKKIALVTSNNTAAYNDVINTLNSRYQIVEVELYDTLVQGEIASKNIIERLIEINKTQDIDLVIIARGGGSIEDLWCFNSEELAITVSNMKIPVITGVGHETDTTLIDYAARLRALTPTDAAFKAVPNKLDLLESIDDKRRFLDNLYKNKIDFLEYNLNRTVSNSIISNSLKLLESFKNNLSYKENLLRSNSPSRKQQLKVEELKKQSDRLENSITTILNTKKLKMNNSVNYLEAVSPLNVIKRGYAIVKSEEHVLTSIEKVKVNDVLELKFTDGTIKCDVIEVNKDGKI